MEIRVLEPLELAPDGGTVALPGLAAEDVETARSASLELSELATMYAGPARVARAERARRRRAGGR